MKKYQIVPTDRLKEYETGLLSKIGEYQNLYNMQDALLLLAVAVEFKIDMNEIFIILNL